MSPEPRSIIVGKTARTVNIEPSRFVSISARQRSGSPPAIELVW